MFSPYFLKIGINPQTKRPLSLQEKELKPAGISLIDFDNLIQSKSKEDFVVVEFKLTEGSVSCIP